MSIIKEEKLVENTAITGQFLGQQLDALQRKHAAKVSNARGIGTFRAFDLTSAELRDKLVSQLRNAGVEISGCGSNSIRIRPMLVFTPRHAQQFVEILDKSLAAL